MVLIGCGNSQRGASVADYEDRYYNSADGLRLHYRDYEGGAADQPPILCLPGLTRNGRDFEPVAEHVAGDWRVIALDFRGRGGSDPDPDPMRYGPKTYVADVLKLLDQLGIAEAVFVGTSLGGLTTMLLAASDDERVAGALINDIGPEVDQRGIDRIRTYVGNAAEWDSFAAAAADFAARMPDVYPRWTSAEWERFARRTCREGDGGQVTLDYDMAIAKPFAAANDSTQPNLWPLLHGLRDKPVAVLRGSASDLFSAEVADRMIADLGESAELVTVPDVGHAPSFDEPQSIAALDRLLARVRV
jgi:pimeloyl-ACP methyl ester carboxylesterase